MLNQSRDAIAPGAWAAWVEQEVKITARHANNYMRIASHRQELEAIYAGEGGPSFVSMRQTLALIRTEPRPTTVVVPAGGAAAKAARAHERFSPAPRREAQLGRVVEGVVKAIAPPTPTPPAPLHQARCVSLADIIEAARPDLPPPPRVESPEEKEERSLRQDVRRLFAKLAKLKGESVELIDIAWDMFADEWCQLTQEEREDFVVTSDEDEELLSFHDACLEWLGGDGEGEARS